MVLRSSAPPPRSSAIWREPRPHPPNWISSLSKPSRSEEHTSELQSPCNLVCRLLLEKKYRLCAPQPAVGPGSPRHPLPPAQPAPPPRMLQGLRAAYSRGARIASIFFFFFLIAAAPRLSPPPPTPPSLH